MARYKVVFLGLAVAGPEEENRLLKGLQNKFSLTPERADSLLQRVPIVVKKGDSREELERYMRAFEEIGGKVRLEVEEEPAAEQMTAPRIPPPQPPPPPEPEKRAYAGKTITCPQCGFEQPETDECAKCGVIISKYHKYREETRAIRGKVREQRSEQKPAWESGEGFIGAFFKTTFECLFHPVLFYRKVALGEGYLSPLIYGLIIGIIGMGGITVWQWLLASFMPRGSALSHIPSPFHLIPIIIFMPFALIAGMFIGSAVVHVCLIIVGGSKNGFQATFRVICYSFCTYLLLLVPVLGALVSTVYMPILTIIGVREGHGISTGRAVLGVLLPAILGLFLAIIAGIFLGFLFGSLKPAGLGV